MIGLLAKLEKSKKYAVYFIEEAKLLEESKKEEKIEMVRVMEKDKEPLEKIQKYTQLSLEQIDKL